LPPSDHFHSVIVVVSATAQLPPKRSRDQRILRAPQAFRFNFEIPSCVAGAGPVTMLHGLGSGRRSVTARQDFEAAEASVIGSQ
jgi:hypothetical protein